ncbi:MAG: hypothetical protein LBR16_06875 [Treponema sp.]|jgi:hypothetical protein|nr:hypothetical protein [Treponema sp.]
MKQTLFFPGLCALLLPAALLLGGCDLLGLTPAEPENDVSAPVDTPLTDAEDPSAEPEPAADMRTFWAQSASGSAAWYQISAQRAVETGHCIVYGDISLLAAKPADGKWTTGQAQALADEFETKALPLLQTHFGDTTDIDGNGKVIFLLLDIQDGYTGSGGYVAGYFDPTHMKAGSHSNYAEMLFLDLYPSEAGTESFYATMVHEMQHLINYSETTAKGRKAKAAWIDEGLSAGAEYLYSIATGGSGDPGGRINTYNYYMNSRISLSTAERIDTCFHWDSSLMDYSTGWLFFYWLQTHAGSGAGIYKAIIKNYNDGDYRDVAAAAAAGIDPAFADWNKLLSTWMIANRAQNTSGYYGYKRAAFLNTMTFSGSSAKLYPGEGMYSTLRTTKTLADTASIKYLTIDSSAATVDEDGVYSWTPYFVAYLLTLNVNTNMGAGLSTGSLAGDVVSRSAEAASESGGETLFPVDSLPERYPVSFGDMQGR